MVRTVREKAKEIMPPHEPLTESKKQEILRLLDQFYQENKDIISKEDYEKAKSSPEYFLYLVKSLTKAHYDVAKMLLANLDIDQKSPH